MRKLASLLESLSTADKTYLGLAQGFIGKAKSEVSSADSDLKAIQHQLASYSQGDEKGHNEIAELMVGLAEELLAIAGGIKGEFASYSGVVQRGLRK